MWSKTLLMTAGVLGLLVAGVFSEAGATDRKILAPQGVCAPYTPTTSMSELMIRPYGITNGGTTAEAVMCTIINDSETNWTATDFKNASLEVTFQSGVFGGQFICQAYVGSGMDGTAAVFSQTTNLPPNQVSNVSINDINADTVAAGFMANYPVSLYCRIPPKSTMLRIRVHELGAQDTDDSGF